MSSMWSIVSREIIPELNSWRRHGRGMGDCNDHAITKRHILIAHGWPPRALLLSEVVVPSGQHDLVLKKEMNANVRPVSMTYRQYRWVRIELPQNPRFWATVSALSMLRVADAD